MKLTHPILTKVAQSLIDKVPQQLREPLERAVQAGNKVMHSKETRRMFKNQMSQEMPAHELVGEGCAKIVVILWRDSGGKLPLRVLIPAGLIITMQGLEFMMDAGVLDEVTNQDIDEATKHYVSSFLQLMGVTPEMMQQILEQGAAQMQQQGADPSAAAAPAQPQQSGGIIAGAAGGM